jgi:hypothetical protein
VVSQTIFPRWQDSMTALACSRQSTTIRIEVCGQRPTFRDLSLFQSLGLFSISSIILIPGNSLASQAKRAARPSARTVMSNRARQSALCWNS